MAVTLAIVVLQNSQSVANNTSTVTVKVNASYTNGSYNLLEKSGSVTIDGTKYSFTSPFNTSQKTSGTTTLYTKTVTIPHNDNGKKTLSVSASYNTGVSSGTISASCSVALTTIPRTSSLTAANGTLGTAQTLTINKADSSFKHSIIAYAISENTGALFGQTTVCTQTTNSSVSYTPPLSYATGNPKGSTVRVQFGIATYTSNGTYVGSVMKVITCTIPQITGIKPTCSLAISDATNAYATYGAYVKGVSMLKIALTTTTYHDATVSSRSITAFGKTYNTQNVTVDVNKAGVQTISATVKDSRSFSGTDSETIDVMDYTKPAIDLLKVGRCDANGVADDQGEFVIVTFSATVSPLNNKNTAKYIIRYKKTTEEWTAGTSTEITDIANNYSVENKTFIFPATTDNSYNVELTVKDTHNEAFGATAASTAFSLMHFKADGTGIAFGKLAEESNLLDVGLNARFNGQVSGNVLGLNRLPKIPAGSDLNDYLQTGCWAVYGNGDAGQIANMPKQINSLNSLMAAGRLEVSAATGEGIRDSEWSYLRQRYIPYDLEYPTFERDVTRNTTNTWTYSEWIPTSICNGYANVVYHGQKVLWGADLASGMYMTNGHTATLLEKVSKQPNGIILVFCYYNGADDTNWGWITRYVPKQIVALEPGGGHTFELANSKFGSVGTKYLYINDGSIVGHADNNLSGTAGSGITYANNKFVLRYVFGV